MTSTIDVEASPVFLRDLSMVSPVALDESTHERHTFAAYSAAPLAFNIAVSAIHPKAIGWKSLFAKRYRPWSIAATPGNASKVNMKMRIAEAGVLLA